MSSLPSPHPFPITAASVAAWACAVLFLTGCQSAPPPPAPVPVVAVPAPPPPPPVVVPSPPPPIDPVTDSDRVMRRLLAFQDRLAHLDDAAVTAQIALLDHDLTDTHSSAAPDVVLDLALALQRRHAAGDMARAGALLEALTQSPSPESEPWQPVARLLAAFILDVKQLEDQLEQEATQRRDTQRALQQTTEKLEALKAIERSMSTHGPVPRTP